MWLMAWLQEAGVASGCKSMGVVRMSICVVSGCCCIRRYI